MVNPIPNGEQPVVDGIDVVQVLSGFGLRLTGPVKRLPEGLDNTNLTAVTNRGVVVIRKYQLADLDRVQMELNFARYLATRDYPTPEPMPTINGSYAIEYRNRPVAVFLFVPGSIPESISEDLARPLGGLLARIHLLGQDWGGRLPVIDRLNSLRYMAEQPSDLAGWQEWQSFLSAFLAQHRHRLESVLSILPAGPIHHDARRQNVIVQDGVIVALLDFGEINIAPFVIDLLRLCHYIAAETRDYRLPQDLAAAAFDQYRAVRQLSHRERQVLNSLFDLVNLCDAADFLRSPPQEVTSVYDCRSLQVYLANSGFRFEAIL